MLHSAVNNRSGALQHLLLRYTRALLTQMAQTAVYNRYHTVDQQLCRWLLLSLERSLSRGVTRRARGSQRAGPELKRTVGALPGGLGRGSMEVIENAITRGTHR